MFSKLALRNVRRSFRDYGVYLLTLTFGVCLFYTFNSIDGQGVMVYLAQSQNPMAQLIQTILDIFSVFVAVVLACLPSLCPCSPSGWTPSPWPSPLGQRCAQWAISA